MELAAWIILFIFILVGALTACSGLPPEPEPEEYDEHTDL